MSDGNLPVDDEKRKNTILQSPFPKISNGKIETVLFLNACKGLVALLEKFGKVFTAVKCDMNGNIVKLTNKYVIDKEKFFYLDEMILSEKGTEIIATDALLWLNRGLHFVERFFELLIEDTSCNDELVPILKTAYKETLKQHHGWIAHQLFELIVRVCPNRSQVIRNICSNDSDTYFDESLFLPKMGEYVSKLKENVSTISKFYKEHDLEKKFLT